MKRNIFTYEGKQGELVEIFYKLLITGNVISYEDVLKEHDGGKLSAPKVSGHDLYQTLKKVIPVWLIRLEIVVTQCCLYRTEE